jgi:hypothetical protein
MSGSRMWDGRRAARGLRGDDRGAVLVLASIVLLALFIMTALVVDLGMSRQTRRNAQVDADMAVLAAGWVFAGNGLDSVIADPRQACKAAVDSVRINVPDFPLTGVADMIGTTVAGPLATVGGQCGILPMDCPDAGTYILTSKKSAPYRLIFQWPVPDSDIARSGVVESKTFDGEPCDRIRVTLERDDPSIFGRVIGYNGRTMRASATARGILGEKGESAPALLLLERVACGTIQVSGQGSISVRSFEDQVGIMHSDSSARTSDTCNFNENAGGRDIYGGVASDKWPSIKADGVEGGARGRIQTYSVFPGVNGRGGAEVNPNCSWTNQIINDNCYDTKTGLSSAPIGASIVSRRPVDSKYQANVGSVYAEAWGRVHNTNGTTRTTTPPAGFTLYATCSPSNQVITAAQVFVDCPGGFTANNVVFTGTEVVFNGPLGVNNNRYLAAPNVRKFYVRGGITLVSGAKLSVNAGSSSGLTTAPASWPAAANSCLTERPPGDPSRNWTQLVAFGPVTVGNDSLQLCQTMGLLTYNTGSAYQAVQSTSGHNCSTTRPCPADSPPAGVTGSHPIISASNSNNIFWTAPNRSSGGATVYTGDSPFEDLALWTEAIGTTSSGECNFSGNPTVIAGGVFFHPNCNFKYSGKSNADNPFNAQFVGRRINMSGQGAFALRPNPADSIKIPVADRTELIR